MPKKIKIKAKKYKIVLLPQAKRDLSKLSIKERKKVLMMFEEISKNPKIGKKVKGTTLRYVDI